MKIKTIITEIKINDEYAVMQYARDHDNAVNDALAGVPNFSETKLVHQAVPRGLHNHLTLVTTITHQ